MLSKDQKAPLGDKLVPLISLLDQWPHRGLGGITDVLAWMEQTKQDLLDSYKSSPSRTPQCLEVHLWFGVGPNLGFLANPPGGIWGVGSVGAGSGMGQASTHPAATNNLTGFAGRTHGSAEWSLAC